ncbi:MAG TPA: aromatic amino acid lyase, partial [Chitinophagaceae bacterium]|nr:aromatic amino acid lyase [Chitinophagaceae bacterium]
MEDFLFGKEKLTVEKTIVLLNRKTNGVLCDEVRERINRNASQIQDIINREDTVYGITTGFGILA